MDYCDVFGLGELNSHQEHDLVLMLQIVVKSIDESFHLLKHILTVCFTILGSRHFKRPIGLAIAEPEVQVISLCDKEQGPGQGQCQLHH